MAKLPQSVPVDWSAVECILLDLDGTLLDLHFDNHFWLEHVPLRYAERQHITVEESKRRLYDRFQALRGTLRWYCLDHWADELKLDIVRLKREVEHLIDIRPNVVRFLDQARDSGRRIVLATNAHPDSLLLKMERTRLDGHFDAMHTAHGFAAPKEEAAYWDRLFETESVAPAHCLLIDDNTRVLRAAASCSACCNPTAGRRTRPPGHTRCWRISPTCCRSRRARPGPTAPEAGAGLAPGRLDHSRLLRLATRWIR